MVLFGGGLNGLAGPPQPQNDTWTWDGTVWLNVSNSGPSPRYLPSMAFDQRRSRAVLFGGSVSLGQAFGDTWEWDGQSQSWEQQFPTNPPGARALAAMAYDTRREVVVLFGGNVGATRYGDTWEWNGSEWDHRDEVPGPNPRSHHSMAYDSLRGVTVLFGGYDGAQSFFDTWEWNGILWTKVSPTSAIPNPTETTMTFDSTRSRLVLYGGGGDDTWEWTGSSWGVVSTTGVGPRRFYNGLAYDSDRRKVVLFGGATNSNQTPIGDTWERGVPFDVAVTDSPDSQTAVAEGAVSFTVVATGTGPLAYQWRRNYAALSDDAAVSGSVTPTLTIDPVTLSDSATYDCVISDSCGAVPSGAATLVVYCPADYNRDGFVDGIDSDQFNNDFEAGNMAADYNGDGFVDGIDYDRFNNDFEAGC